MWIVRVALSRPYTFIVVALLLLLISPLVILRTPTDIFPNVNIPVVAVLWNYTGLSAEEMEERITTGFERGLTTSVSDMEHIESQTVNGRSIVKVFFHPAVKVEMAVAQVTALAQSSVRQMPPGTTPPYILVYSASSVPILQLGLSGKGLNEQQLFDFATQQIRTALATVQGAAIPWPYGGKQRQVMIDIRQDLLKEKGLSPADVVNAVSQQNLILPAGTSKIGQFEYDVDLNSSPARVQELNDLPIKAVGNTTIYIHDVAHVRDGYSPQTNIVRRDGLRGVLLTIMKVGSDVDAGYRPTGSRRAAGDCRDAAAGVKDRSDCGSIGVCARGRERSGARGDYRGVPHRGDDLAVSGKLAQYADHRDFDSSLHSDVDLHHERVGRDDQHHDAGRAGAGGRHPG